MANTNALDVLIQALRRLPGVGVKSASRMAFHLLQHDRMGARALSRALQEAADSVQHCERCHTFTEAGICATCLDARRDASKLCVVEQPGDLLPREDMRGLLMCRSQSMVHPVQERRESDPTP